MVTDDFLDGASEFLREQLVRFVHNNHATFAQIRNLLTCQVCYSAGCTDDDMDGIAQTEDIVSEVCSAG